MRLKNLRERTNAAARSSVGRRSADLCGRRVTSARDCRGDTGQSERRPKRADEYDLLFGADDDLVRRGVFMRIRGTRDLQRDVGDLDAIAKENR